MKDILKEYIIKKYGIENFEEIIKKNYLNYIYTEEPHNVKLLLNKANVMLLQNELIKICKKFDEQKIKYIAFKGAVLSNRLYDNIYTRFFSDIDIFVFPQHFEKALDVLYHNGYVLRYSNGLSNLHHVILANGRIVLELHRRILDSFTQIDESYMYNHTEILELSKQKVVTFDLTGTLLHQFYHLYMHYLSVFRMRFIYSNAKLPVVNKFLLYAYEIASFSRKYFVQIGWNEIIADIKNQKIRIIFRKMISDILKVFPDAFPKQFTEVVENLKYVDDKNDDFYKFIINSNQTFEKIDVSLCDFINLYWNKQLGKKIQINKEGEFVLTSSATKDEIINHNYAFECVVRVRKVDGGIELNFKVTNEDFCFSKINDYNTQTSDGVHLIVCGTEKYSYNSIFLFPKIVDGKTIVIPINVLNGVNSEINESLISTSYEKFETEYLITAVLKNEFLKINNIEEYFYLGLVISDCSNKTKKRKSVLILSEPYNEWYNPTCFAKIKIS